MVYLVNKILNTLVGTFDNTSYANDYLAEHGEDAENYFILTELDSMKYVNRIAYVDGKCVYNNKEFWSSDLSKFIAEYDKHDVQTILGDKETVNQARFISEYHNMINKINAIDGRAGQIEYNMQVGKEFVSLFREECILTNFTKDSDTSPMKIFEKLTPVIAMLDAGAFREAKQYLAGYRQMLKDDFLTDERIDKYIAMLDAADAIEYATEEDYFYTAPEVVNDSAV